MPSAMRIFWTPFLPSWPNFPSSSLKQFLLLVLTPVFTIFLATILNCLVVHFDWQWFMLIMVGYAFMLYLCLVLLLFVCAWLGWPISLMYHILECIAGFFPHYPSGGNCKCPILPCVIWPPFFDGAKRGKMSMTLFGLVCLVLSWLLKFFFFHSCVAWMVGTNLFLSLYGQYGHMVCHHQKGGKLLIPSLYKVLIITNPNVMVHMVLVELCVVDRIHNIFEISS